jgi:hypothetical protein
MTLRFQDWLGDCATQACDSLQSEHGIIGDYTDTLDIRIKTVRNKVAAGITDKSSDACQRLAAACNCRCGILVCRVTLYI